MAVYREIIKKYCLHVKCTAMDREIMRLFSCKMHDSLLGNNEIVFMLNA